MKRSGILDGLIRKACAAVFLFVALSFAQTYDAVGLILDAEKGEPIAGVRIELKSGKLLGVSKSNGRFEVTVNNRGAILVFKRNTYKDQELDLAEVASLVDLEVSLESEVLELAAKDTVARRGVARDIGGAHSLEELEQLQGMRIDLNDHLRQLPGVSGMNEFTSDISIWGSRTHDVTHYLGQSRIPSLRHLDFGFPGNQSVLNPRLLKSVTVADNLAKGPLNQGNASALVYDLKDGDPNNIHGDLVYGTINRELNLTGYWEGRTYILSGRYLEPTFLSNIGEKFFTEAKDARLKNDGQRCDSTKTCTDLKDPFDFRSGDLYLGTFHRDSTGAFGRHSLISLDDSYEVNQDVGKSLQETKAQTIISGVQDAWMYAYEGLSLMPSGDLSYAVSGLFRNRENSDKDTAYPVNKDLAPDWYPPASGDVTDYQLGQSDIEDVQATASFQWNPNAQLGGAAYGYGLDLEYLGQRRLYTDELGRDQVNRQIDLPQEYALANVLFRMRWVTGNKAAVDAAAGLSLVYQGLLDGEDAGAKAPLPLASLRYTHPLAPALSGYGEMALRQNTAMEPVGYNRLEAVTTSSLEGKLGATGNLGETFQFTGSVYTRFYRDPSLPIPEVYWNFEETHSSDFAYVNGGNATLFWTPSHHAGLGINASVVQGDYHLEDGNYLPWEANRTLDMVANLRLLPRRDSLVSIILTYGANNGAPLYEYGGLYDRGATARRTVRQSTDFPTVSRQRTDIRVNLDLASRFKPLSGFRFFFELDNLFANTEGSAWSFLGGENRRRRGWTRYNNTGDLEPVVTKGLGLYLLFGFEGRLVI